MKRESKLRNFIILFLISFSVGSYGQLNIQPELLEIARAFSSKTTSGKKLKAAVGPVVDHNQHVSANTKLFFDAITEVFNEVASNGKSNYSLISEEKYNLFLTANKLKNYATNQYSIVTTLAKKEVADLLITAKISTYPEAYIVAVKVLDGEGDVFFMKSTTISRPRDSPRPSKTPGKDPDRKEEDIAGKQSKDCEGKNIGIITLINNSPQKCVVYLKKQTSPLSWEPSDDLKITLAANQKYVIKLKPGTYTCTAYEHEPYAYDKPFFTYPVQLEQCDQPEVSIK